jgi:hypothetical protein
MFTQLYRLIKEATKAVPATKYAVGVAGIVAVVGLIKALNIDLRIAVWGTVVIFILMTVLVVFAKLTKVAPQDFKGPIILLMWSSVIIFIVVSVFLASSVFFKWPVDLQYFLKQQDDKHKIVDTPAKSPSTPHPDSLKTGPVKPIAKTFSINIRDETLIDKIQRKSHYLYTPLSRTHKILITFDSSEIKPDGSDFFIEKSRPKVYIDEVFCKFLDTTIESSESLPKDYLYENARKNCQRVATAYLTEHPEILLKCLR